MNYYEGMYSKVLKFFDGDEEKTELWWNSENYNLGNVTPIIMVLSGRAKKLDEWIDEQLKENIVE